MADFKQRFLLRMPRKSADTDLSLVNICEGLAGRRQRPDRSSRAGSTPISTTARHSRDLLDRTAAAVWINASDIYNRTPFVFGRDDIRRAVQRSVELSGLAGGRGFRRGAGGVRAGGDPEFPGRLPDPLPEWVERVRNDARCARRSSRSMPTRWSAITPARSNTSSCSTAASSTITGLRASPSRRLASNTPYGPLAAGGSRQAAAAAVPGGGFRPRAVGQLGADSGRPLRRRTHHGGVGHRDRIRRGRQLFGVRRTRWTIGSDDWSSGAAGFRKPSAAGYGAPPGWNCKDVKFFIGRVAFDQLGPERAAALNAVETRFKLPPDQVDMLIDAGRDALENQHCVPRVPEARCRRHRRPRGAPVAAMPRPGKPSPLRRRSAQ